MGKTGKHLESIFPQGLQLWLYRMAIDRGHLDTVLERVFVQPLVQVSLFLARLDRIGLPSAPADVSKPSAMQAVTAPNQGVIDG